MSASVTVVVGAIGFGGSVSNTNFNASVVTTGASGTQVTMAETVAVDPPFSE